MHVATVEDKLGAAWGWLCGCRRQRLRKELLPPAAIKGVTAGDKGTAEGGEVEDAQEVGLPLQAPAAAAALVFTICINTSTRACSGFVSFGGGLAQHVTAVP